MLVAEAGRARTIQSEASSGSEARRLKLNSGRRRSRCSASHSSARCPSWPQSRLQPRQELLSEYMRAGAEAGSGACTSTCCRRASGQQQRMRL